MPQLARKLIDAIQNTLLGPLAFRLLMSVMPAAALLNIRADFSALWFSIGVGGSLALLMLGVWGLGAIANRMPQHSTHMDRVHMTRRSGFDAWFAPPHGGFAPSPSVRGFIMSIASTPSWIAPLALLVWWATLIGLHVLSWSSSDWLTHQAPWLLRHENSLWASNFISGPIFVLLAWAADARRLLDPQTTRTVAPA